MFANELRRAAEAAPRVELPKISALLWKAYAAGQVTEVQASELSDLIEARKAIPAPQKPVQRRVGSQPRTSASMERRRSWAASGCMPPCLAARFTLAEQAVLSVVAVEVSKHAACTLTVDHIAALAGVGPSSVRNAIREAKALGLVTVEERRRTAWMSYPNTVRIVSSEWGSWLRLHGFKSVKPTTKHHRKEDKTRSVTNCSKGFRSEEAAQAPRSTKTISSAQATSRSHATQERGLPDQPGMAGGSPATRAMPGVQWGGVHRNARMRGS